MSTDKTLMRLLAQARPRRLDPDPAHRPDPSTVMAHSRLHSPVRPARRPARRLVLASLVPATALVATGAIFLASHTAAPAGTGSAGAQAAPRTARELLLMAAEHSTSSAATSGKYVVISQEQGQSLQVGPAGRPYHIMLRRATERWSPTTPGEIGSVFGQSLGAAPASPEDTAAWRADGSPKTWVAPDVGWSEQAVGAWFPHPKLRGAKPVVIDSAPGDKHLLFQFAPGGVQQLADINVTAADLAALPSDPATLRQWLLDRSWDKQHIPYALFLAGTEIVLNPTVRAEVRAAAYRMLADVDGVTSVGQVTDHSGRSGVAVGYARKVDEPPSAQSNLPGGHWEQYRLVIDPQTWQMLAVESWDLGSGSAPTATGELLTYTLLTGWRYTNEEPSTATATPHGDGQH